MFNTDYQLKSLTTALGYGPSGRKFKYGAVRFDPACSLLTMSALWPWVSTSGGTQTVLSRASRPLAEVVNCYALRRGIRRAEIL